MKITRSTIIRFALGTLAVGMLATGCGGGDDTQASTPAEQSPTTTTAATGTGSVEGTLTVKELVPPKQAPVRGVDSESDAVVATKVFNALAAGPSNSVLSSNRAYLQSAGICGGASTGFDINSQGFEYLQIGSAARGATTFTWGQLTQVPQNVRQHYPLPVAPQPTAYVVWGWDWTAQGWEAQYVFTSFDHILSGAFSSWFC